jgi:hypothetical protein
MANSLKHSSVGTELTQAEWEAIDGHVIESQATGDTIYAASSTSLRRLAIGSAGQLLEIASGLPAWTSSPTIGSTSWANANHAHAASNSGGTVAGSALSGSSLASGITSSSLTSVGTLTTLTVDNIIVNGTTIGHTSDTDLLTFADGVLTVAGEISVTTLDIGGTNVTSTAAELNLLDGSSANSVVNSKAVIYGSSGELAGTLSTVAQGNVTSLGTLTALTVDNIAVNGTTIGHTSDTDLLTLASGVLTVAGEISVTTLDIGGTNVTSTAAELNLLDGSSANTVVNSKAVVYGGSGELAGTLSTAAQANVTSLGTLTTLGVGNAPVSGYTAVAYNDSGNTQVRMSGDGADKYALFAYRNLGSGATSVPVVYFNNDEAGDDQPVLRVNQAGSGDIAQFYDGGAEVWSIANGGDVDMNNNDLHNVGHADNDWTTSYIGIKGYQRLRATNNYVQGHIAGSDPNIYRIMNQEDSVADNTARDLFKITTVDDQSTMFTAYLDYVVMSDYQETIESGRFLITGGRRYASGNAVVQIEKVYDDTADARGGGETITVSLAGTVSGASDAAQDITFAMTADTQHSNPWNCKWHATVMGGYAAGGASDFITATVV